jgi:dodecin
LSNHTYSISEIVGTSTQGVDDAVRNGIAKASQTLRNLDWFEVKEVRGHLEDGKVADWQVTIKIGFRLEGQE